MAGELPRTIVLGRFHVGVYKLRSDQPHLVKGLGVEETLVARSMKLELMRMIRFNCVVAPRTTNCESDMEDGSQSLKAVMVGAMK